LQWLSLVVLNAVSHKSQAAAEAISRQNESVAASGTLKDAWSCERPLGVDVSGTVWNCCRQADTVDVEEVCVALVAETIVGTILSVHAVTD